MTPSPSESLRDHLRSRTTKTLIQSGAKIGHLSDSDKKTPSQKRSENLRKKLNRGAQPDIKAGEDCNGCSKYPCGKTVKHCSEPSRKNRCKKCGGVVIYRYVEGQVWEYCEPCRSGFR